MTVTAHSAPRSVPRPAPRPILSLGITGHRPGNSAFSTNRAAIAATLEQVFDKIAAAAGDAPVRMNNLLAEGADHLAAHSALARRWDLVAPLPFGRLCNAAINANPRSLADADALLAGAEAQDPQTQARAAAIHTLTASAQVFELAERDALMARLLREKLAAPGDADAAEAFAVRCAARVALAGRVLIEQSDLVIGMWDGASRAYIGGTGHTILTALEHGCPVIWIDVQAPGDWTILHAPEALAAPRRAPGADRDAELAALVAAALRPAGEDGAAAFTNERWRPRSNRWWTGYRRIEALFGGEGRPFRSLAQFYESPDAIATGSAAAVLATARSLPGGDAAFAQAMADNTIHRFAWADGISAWLSDAYRGGMTANFLLAAFAVVAGLAYQPVAGSEHKWIFASVELLLLTTILFITWLGGKLRWHERWFETRRVAEYLRHAPILLLLGVARAPGRWPQGGDVAWPEYHARHALRMLGLPRVAITAPYLRQGLADLLDPHVLAQRDYHHLKAKRLTAVHHKLDSLSTRLFQLAVVGVATYLLLKAIAALHLIPHEWPHATSYAFTFLGVALPTFGAAIAGIRYFGDFERFAAISEVTAAKLDAVHARIALLLEADDDHLDYARVTELVHAADEIVVTEIENWQAVFGGKHIAVPV